MTLIKATLLPDTTGCLDFHHTESCSEHDCTASPGGIVTCECGKQLVVGDTIQLIRIPPESFPGIADCKMMWLDDSSLVDCTINQIDFSYDKPPTTLFNYQAVWDWVHQELPIPDYPFGGWQWKGTVASWKMTCECGANLVLNKQDFASFVMCPVCRTQYYAYYYISIKET